jgi:hypothetical protein
VSDACLSKTVAFARAVINALDAEEKKPALAHAPEEGSAMSVSVAIHARSVLCESGVPGAWSMEVVEIALHVPICLPAAYLKVY